MSIINSFSANTTIESAKVNANFTDIASEITASLPRNGEAGMSGQFAAADGTSSAPGISFGTDTNTGLYREAADKIGVAAGGSKVASFSASGILDSVGLVITAVPTGALMMYGATTSPTGWVRCNARTIGNASSSATERANADTENLFTFLWTNYSDSVCAVSSGRGASAAADYAANKTIALPDLRGRALFGLDDMGNSAAGRLAAATINETTNGATGGADTVTLARANLPNDTVNPTVSISDPGHGHSLNNYDNLMYDPGTGRNRGTGSNNVGLRDLSLNNNTTGITATSTFALNGGVTQTAVDKLPPAFLTTFIIKL
jgi:microcystin-dependent protein